MWPTYVILNEYRIINLSLWVLQFTICSVENFLSPAPDTRLRSLPRTLVCASCGWSGKPLGSAPPERAAPWPPCLARCRGDKRNPSRPRKSSRGIFSLQPHAIRLCPRPQEQNEGIGTACKSRHNHYLPARVFMYVCVAKRQNLREGRDTRPPAAVLSLEDTAIVAPSLNPDFVVPLAQWVRECREAVEAAADLSTSLEVRDVEMLGPSGWTVGDVNVHVFNHQGCYPAMHGTNAQMYRHLSPVLHRQHSNDRTVGYLSG